MEAGARRLEGIGAGAPRGPGGGNKKLLDLARVYCGEAASGTVLKGNAAIWALLVSLHRQWRTISVGTNGIVISQRQGLDMRVAAEMAPAFGIRPNQIFFEKLHTFERACIECWYPEQVHGCTEKKKTLCRERHGKYFDWACRSCKEKKHGTH